MRFSSALATAVLSFVSLASADNLGVATVYRYIDSTATVYANYCPCAATTTLTGLPAGTSRPQTPVVNNNAGSNNAPTTGGNTGSTSGSTPASPAAPNGGNNGANTGAQPNGQAPGSTYITVVVQYQTSVVYSTFSTTITLGPQQTITSVVTNTITATVPVTITSTVTVPNNGAGVDPNANSRSSIATAPFGNSTISALTSTSALTTATDSAGSGVDAGQNTLSGSATITVSADSSASTTASAVSSTTNSAGSGVDAGQNTLSGATTTTAATDAASTSATVSVDSTSTSALASVDVTSTSALASVPSDVSSTVADVSSTVADAGTSTITDLASTTTDATSAATTDATSTSSAAPTVTNVYFRFSPEDQDPADTVYYNNIYIDLTVNPPVPRMYTNGGDQAYANLTSFPTFDFFLTDGGNTFTSRQADGTNAAQVLCFSESITDLAAGTPVGFYDSTQVPTGITCTNWLTTTTQITATAPDTTPLNFYVIQGYQLYVTSSTTAPANAFDGRTDNTPTGNLPLQSTLPVRFGEAQSADVPPPQ